MAGQRNLQHIWFDEIWNQGREERIDDLLQPDVIGHGLIDENGVDVKGVEGFKAFYKSFRAAFPDIHVEVKDTVSEGDQIVARCKVTATHSGDGFGMPATNRPVCFYGTCWVRVRDGKIAESWNNFDFLSLMQQLQPAS